MSVYHVFLSAMFTSFTLFVKFHVVGHFCRLCRYYYCSQW